jgi:two-component system chemotaxis response regulator CheY
MISNSTPEPVLLVEDDLDIRDILSEVLEREGYQVTMASSGREALQHLATDALLPRVILLDFMMPGMDGWEFRERQRKNPAWAQIPVIVLSADRNTTKEAEGIGALGSLRKPLDIDQLLEMLAMACSGGRIPHGAA